MYDNSYIAEKLKLIGKLLEIQGENSFKTRAYSRGAEIIKKLGRPVNELIESGELANLDGIGSALRQKIIDLSSTGTCPALQRLESEIPPGVIDMLRIKGVGPKKIATIWKEMEITSIGELLYACNENRLVEVKGFGEKTQEKIRQTIEYLMANEDNFRFAMLWPYAVDFIQKMEAILGADARVSLTGDIRRKMPVLSGIDVIVSEAVKSDFLAGVDKMKGFERGDAKDSVVLHPSETRIPIRVSFASGNFWLTLWQTTGSEDHVASLSPNPDTDYQSEAEIYQSLGLQFVAPEMREDMGEVDLARENALPELITEPDIKGMMHNHSTWSDGLHSLAQMAKAAKDMGMEYLGISDHSKSAFYANGLSVERIRQQHAEIDELNAKMAPFKILKGIESDILSDGSLDYEDEVLATFDFVIASVHSILNMDEARATERLIKAIENPYTSMLGHPTGRLLLMREGYPINHRAVIDACAAHGVAIEINANPARLDLDWSWIPYATEKGVMISVNPDAHKMEGYEDTWWGIAAARKGRLTAAQCLNAQPLSFVEEFFQNQKQKRGVLPA